MKMNEYKAELDALNRDQHLYDLYPLRSYARGPLVNHWADADSFCQPNFHLPYFSFPTSQWWTIPPVDPGSPYFFHLEALPDEVLSTVLDQLPTLYELMRSRRVSRRWHRLIMERCLAGRSELSRRTLLPAFAEGQRDPWRGLTEYTDQLPCYLQPYIPRAIVGYSVEVYCQSLQSKHSTLSVQTPIVDASTPLGSPQLDHASEPVLL